MTQVKLLIGGKHEKAEEGLNIGSSVTLIKTDKNIIVDTGSFLDKDKIISELEKENLKPEDIDIVILTHLHLDHTVNTYLFKNAKIYCKFKGDGYPGQFHTPSKGCMQRTDMFDNTEIAKDVKLMLVPGHSGDMVAVIVKTEKGIVVISGDAISDKRRGRFRKTTKSFGDN